MNKVIIVGGGAAGMLASIIAAKNGCAVTLFEKNEKLGKKVYITGKGRCNVTNNCDPEELLQAVMSNPKFLYSAFYSFTSQDMMQLLEDAGVSLKTERGNRVFPVSDHSSDIIHGLEQLMKKYGVQIHLRSEVKNLLTENGIVTGIQLTDNKVYTADAVIVATGGLSYPTTGSTGDGYRFAVETGHTVTECMPSLVPLTTKEAYIPLMKGLSLRNVELTIKRGKKTVYQDFGEMMFTHFGITGPLVLSASAKIGKFLQKGEELSAYLDLKPALSHEQLDDRILREFSSAQNKQFKNVIGVLFPSSLTPVIIGLGPIPEDKVIHDISREERLAFGSLIKAFPFTITGLGGFSEAVITRGGVSVREIQPGTMESKKIKNLYFIGEVLDLDAVTGGYNLQIAWSTAYLAATDVCRNKQEDTQ
nr:NAD(P)/FAD-dependent oxidoreductase [uncultured Blautia sp.]